MRRTLALFSLLLASCGGAELVAPQLSVQVTGAGVITSIPSGIECPGHCEAFFPEGTTITLIATPEDGATGSCLFVDDDLTACGGDCAKTCSVMMGPDRAVRAEFQ